MHPGRYPLLLLVLLLNACSDSSGNNPSQEENGENVRPQFASTCEGDVYVSGTVSREFRDHTWNEPFVVTTETHVHMKLSTFFVDGPSTTLQERDVEFVQLPFDFAICGNAADIEAARQGELAVSVEIYNHEGNDGRVGDLVSEYLNSIDGPTNSLQILVSGLEHCDDPNAGGFCTSNE